MLGTKSLNSTRIGIVSTFKTIKRHVQESREVAAMTTKKECSTAFLPPADVRGMTTLDRSLFAKIVRVPCVVVEQSLLEKALKLVKPHLLKMMQLKAVQDAHVTADNNLETKMVNDGETETTTENKTKFSCKRILLDSRVTPTTFVELPPTIQKGLTDLGVSEFGHSEVTLDYHNWKCEEVLAAVLPADKEGFTSYSRVGHIVHLNLREHLTAYRHLIGNVLTDKLKGVTLVVNKTDSIDNEFRNFEMEVLAGDQSVGTVATVKENGCTFEFDFAKVFWNSRLCTEHGRMVELVSRGGVLYDVFAGVGPFSVPVARSRKCTVLANDLNPASYQWLCHNVTLNKVKDRVSTYNLDGRVFLRTVVRADVVKRWRDYADARTKFGSLDEDVSVTCPDLNVVMNLPALAVNFLDALVGLLTVGPSDLKSEAVEERMVERQIAVHCYTFARLEDFAVAVPQRVESVLGCELDRSTTKTFHVRSVAPNKEMIRVSFLLPTHVLFRIVDVPTGCDMLERGEPLSKKLCTDLTRAEPNK